jgi:hypothetical protein
MTKKYEYKCVKATVGFIKTPDLEKILQTHAHEGWRFVQVVVSGSHLDAWQIVFEREINT